MVCGLLFKEIADIPKFGDQRSLHSPPLDESDSEDEQDLDDNEASMPRTEEWRMNLTALSQYHNVRNTGQILKVDPDF